MPSDGPDLLGRTGQFGSVEEERMDSRPILNDDDHAAALREIDRLMDASAGSPQGEQLDKLVDLVRAYEMRRWPVDDTREPSART